MTDALTKLGYLAGASRFRRISERLHQDGDRIYLNSGIAFRASWFSVFYVLAKSKSPQTILEIAEQIDFTHITVKNILRDLEKSELVKITGNPKDKRSKHVTLTRKGKSLLKKLEPTWLSFSTVLKDVFTSGHPDILNILNRIDREINRVPISRRIQSAHEDTIQVLDYRPGLKKHFYELAGPWLLEVLKGKLEEDDKYTLRNPEKAYLNEGGFLFYAQYKSKIVGCVALKRLDDQRFEFAKLFIKPDHRKLGIATLLIERCISRCKENYAKELWLQTTMKMPEAHKLYYKFGFIDRKPPKQMDVLKRTEKIMYLAL